MEVINPIIMAGSQRAALPNQAQSGDILQGRAAYDHLGKQIAGVLTPYSTGLTSGQMMPDNIAQKVTLSNPTTSLWIYPPALYVLHPGDYIAPQDGADYDIMQAYGVERTAIRRLFFSGYVSLNDKSTCLNFYGDYDQTLDYNYARGFSYIANTLYECQLPLLSGTSGKAAVTLAPLYTLYCNQSLISRDDILNNWTAYSSINPLAMLYEE